MAGWDTLKALVCEELVQRTEEGCDTTGFKEKLEAAGEAEKELLRVYQQLQALPVKNDFPFYEPSELAAIKAARAGGNNQSEIGLNASLSDLEWQDKFKGAWLGRSIGCALGKPLENPNFMKGTVANPGWKNVQLWFQGADAWPIAGYTPGHSRAEQEWGLKVGCPRSQRENISYMESDDDIRYTVLGLLMLEHKGFDFDEWDVGLLWHTYLTYRQVCTAETQAYLNFAQVTSHISSHHQGQKPVDWEIHKEWVRTYLNPYREWIGAQIRADALAYGAAGKPELAAELAYHDAAFSHVKNGIYGEMFVAAMIAAAFVESDPRKLVEIGLSQIPSNSRLAHDIGKAVSITEETAQQSLLIEKLWEAFGHYNPVHTNNNAALVTASLLFAGDDFTKAVSTAVLGGWDTDCNGATVGSIMGAKLGAKALSAEWTAPLSDTLYSDIRGFHPISISECAERSYKVWLKLNSK